MNGEPHLPGVSARHHGAKVLDTRRTMLHPDEIRANLEATLAVGALLSFRLNVDDYSELRNVSDFL